MASFRAGPQTSVDGNAESGQFAANIGAMGSDATLSQAIQTTAGQHYTLTFWLANAGGGPNDFTVKWNGTTLLSLVNAPAQGYTQYTFDVVGTAGTSQLLISARQDPSHWNLDAISVVPAGTQMPAAPSITSFSTDSGAVGDGITNDNTLTLTGTAEANSNGEGVRRRDAAGQRGGERQRGLELYHGGAGERRAQPDRDGDRCGRQYQCGLGRAERDD